MVAREPSDSLHRMQPDSARTGDRDALASAEALHQQGLREGQQGRYERAAKLIRRAIRLRPEAAAYRINLGNCLRMLGRFEPALQACEEALRIAPGSAAARFARGLVHICMGNFEAALSDLPEQPNQPDLMAQRGYVLERLDRPEDAIHAYTAALKLRPDDARTRANRAHQLLLMGQFELGWREYEWRWRNPEFAHLRRNLSAPAWDGSAIKGRRLLLHAEQGLGDTLQFVRYAKLAAEQGASVVLECQPELVTLLSRQSFCEDVVTYGCKLPTYDCHAPLLSLPRIFGTKLETIPSEDAYLTSGNDVHYDLDSSLLNVGVVWAGSSQHPHDAARSLKPECFSEIANVKGVRAHSLQYGAAAPEGFGDLARECTDFNKTASAIDQLDLVITADTGVAHLAGALGKPVWILLPRPCDWRWLQARDDSPWYPTMRLFRQSQIGHWDDVMDDVADALRRTV